MTMHMSANPPLPEGSASRVFFAGCHPEAMRLWRKWMMEQGQPSRPNRAQRRAKDRLVARRRQDWR